LNARPRGTLFKASQHDILPVEAPIGHRRGEEAGADPLARAIAVRHGDGKMVIEGKQILGAGMKHPDECGEAAKRRQFGHGTARNVGFFALDIDRHQGPHHAGHPAWLSRPGRRRGSWHRGGRRASAPNGPGSP